MKEFHIDRYLRHQGIKWLNQEELFQLHVLLIGVGAIGNEVLKNLVLMGIGHITIIDFDKIEIHNLTRSVLFRESDIGKYKVEVAKERAKELNPDPRINIISINSDFYDIINLKFLKAFDGVICAVDNFDARIKLHRLCFLANVDFFNAGIDSQYLSIEYFPYSKTKEICFECNLNPKIYQFIQKRYSCGWIERSAFTMQKIPTTIITASTSAAILTSLFLRKKEYQEPIKIFMDTIYYNITKSQLRNNPNCYFCSHWRNSKEISLRKFINNLSSLPSDTTFFTNEPILVSTHCDRCNYHKEIWQLSRKFKDKDLICSNCNQMMQADVRDHFTKEEIKAILKIPIKYFYYFDLINQDSIFVDKENDTMER